MEEAIISFPMFGDKFQISWSSSFTIFGRNFYWYGVIIAIGFLLAVWYISKKSRDFGIDDDTATDALLWAIPIGVVCARLYYVLFKFSDYKDDLLSIVKIWEGGLAIYGGIIGGFLTICVYCRIKKVKLWALLDVCSLGLLIGQSIGRWGNFINREAYGARTMVPWRMALTTSLGTGYYHPTFFYESLWNAVGFVLLNLFYKKRKYDGQVFLLYVAWYGLGRMVIEGLRIDSLYIGETNLRVSQLLAGLTLLAALIAMFIIKVFGEPDERNLLVNRASAGEQEAPEEAEEESGEDEEYDVSEDESLKYINTPQKPLMEYEEGVPVVEPIEVELHDKDEE